MPAALSTAVADVCLAICSIPCRQAVATCAGVLELWVLPACQRYVDYWLTLSERVSTGAPLCTPLCACLSGLPQLHLCSSVLRTARKAGALRVCTTQVGSLILDFIIQWGAFSVAAVLRTEKFYGMLGCLWHVQGALAATSLRLLSCMVCRSHGQRQLHCGSPGHPGIRALLLCTPMRGHHLRVHLGPAPGGDAFLQGAKIRRRLALQRR